MDFKKYYQGEMVLGITTDTQDSEGKVLNKIAGNLEIDKKCIEKAFKNMVDLLTRFLQCILQVIIMAKDYTSLQGRVLK